MRLFLTLALLTATAAPAAPAAAQVPGGYKLVWSDEFDTAGQPDPAKWVADTHANKTGWYNDERQYYSARRLENARVADGKLIITARRETLRDAADFGGQHYTSARLTTQGKTRWTYGYFEIRAKLPCGQGTWPAIWMLGEGTWPDGGEIDIMEQVGQKPDELLGTIHNRATAGTPGNGSRIDMPGMCTAFHDYQLTWTPEALKIAVDGRPVHIYAKAGKTAAGWPFDRPQYLLLNLAVGGVLGGAVDDTIFPRRFEIDYVRVYQRQ
jgi:beta-glucanase (GH16 family)